jgi:hypothetical protein
MNSYVKWMYLTPKEIISRTIKDVKDGDEQFNKISILRKTYGEKGEPVVSVDSKKKELIETRAETKKRPENYS